MTNQKTKSPRPQKSSKRAAPAPPKQAAPATVKAVTKQAQLILLLQCDNGSSVAELASALSWMPHTTRAALTGLRKKGRTIVSEKANGETRYRIEQAA